MELMLKEIVFLIVGFFLGHVPGWLDRKRKLKTHWYAIRAEMNLCKEKASTLLNDQIQSPLYRLPIIAFQTSFPILLSEGMLAEVESCTMSRFSCQVQDINRGLDYAAEMYSAGNTDKLEKEYDRNCLKAQTLTLSKGGQESLYEAAKKIVDAKISLGWWKY
jgi:hypothetical protein